MQQKIVFFTEHICPKLDRQDDSKLCEFCSQWSPNTKENLKHCNKEHMSHIVSIWQPCPNCIYYYPTKEHLQEHIKNSHSSNKKCNICKSSFTDLRKHIKYVHKNENDKKQCTDCLNYFQNSQELSIHFRKIHFKRAESKIKKALKPDCKYCQLNFKTVSALLQHSNAEHQNEVIADSWLKCPKCSFYLPTIDTLKAHSCLLFDMHLGLSKKSQKFQSEGILATELPQPLNCTSFTINSSQEKGREQMTKNSKPSVETLNFIQTVNSSATNGRLSLQEIAQSNNTQQTQSLVSESQSTYNAPVPLEDITLYYSDEESLSTNAGIQCRFCPELFGEFDKRIYYKHANDFHSEELTDWHQCSTCNLFYPTKRSLERHKWYKILIYYQSQFLFRLFSI